MQVICFLYYNIPIVVNGSHLKKKSELKQIQLDWTEQAKFNWTECKVNQINELMKSNGVQSGLTKLNRS